MVNFIKFKGYKTGMYFLVTFTFMFVLSCTKTSDLKVSMVYHEQTLDNQLGERIKTLISDTYPELLKKYNSDATKTIQVVIDTSYQGVAYASGSKIVASSKWLRENPEDYDLFTHEIMHLIQAYPQNSGPSWLTEGIADYVRAEYGINNKAAQWSLPDYSPSQNYTDSYRVSARFLLWIEKHHDQNFVKKIDQHLRTKTYSEDVWEKHTGVSLDELWNRYGAMPEL